MTRPNPFKMGGFSDELFLLIFEYLSFHEVVYVKVALFVHLSWAELNQVLYESLQKMETSALQSTPLA